MHSGTGPFKVVRCCDPAIEDPVGPAALKYSTTRDFSLLTFAPDSKPTVFHARLLTISERRAVRNLPSPADQYEAAFVRGLVQVDDLVREEDGQPYQWKRPTDHSGKDKPIPDAVIEEHFDEATVQEIGMVILSRSFLARTSGQYFPLPAICRDALSATLLRRALRAAPMSASSSSDASKPPAEACTLEPTKSSPAGDGSTAATATG
jgi:hypothetical protein